MKEGFEEHVLEIKRDMVDLSTCVQQNPKRARRTISKVAKKAEQAVGKMACVGEVEFLDPVMIHIDNFFTAYKSNFAVEKWKEIYASFTNRATGIKEKESQRLRKKENKESVLNLRVGRRALQIAKENNSRDLSIADEMVSGIRCAFCSIFLQCSECADMSVPMYCSYECADDSGASSGNVCSHENHESTATEEVVESEISTPKKQLNPIKKEVLNPLAPATPKPPKKKEAPIIKTEEKRERKEVDIDLKAGEKFWGSLMGKQY